MSAALDAKVRAAIEHWAHLTPEQKEAEIAAQRQSWVRGELAIGLDRQERQARDRIAASLTLGERETLIDAALWQLVTDVKDELAQRAVEGRPKP